MRPSTKLLKTVERVNSFMITKEEWLVKDIGVDRSPYSS